MESEKQTRLFHLWKLRRDMRWRSRYHESDKCTILWRLSRNRHTCKWKYIFYQYRKYCWFADEKLPYKLPFSTFKSIFELLIHPCSFTFHWRFVKEHGTLSRLPSIAVMCFSNYHLLLFYMKILKGVTNEGPLGVKMFFYVVEVEQQVLVSRYFFFCFRVCSRIY